MSLLLAAARRAPARLAGEEVLRAWVAASAGPAPVAEGLEAMNRNARKPKRANHGKRPCSHWGRRRRAKEVNKMKQVKL